VTLWVLVHFECWFADLAEAEDSSLARLQLNRLVPWRSYFALRPRPSAPVLLVEPQRLYVSLN
jgi:hypothetical protein